MSQKLYEGDILGKIKSLTIELELLKQENKELTAQLGLSKISTVGKWSIDLRTSEIYWSDGMFELLNIKKNVTPDMKLFYKKLTRESSDQLSGAIQSLFLTKKDFSFEHEINRDDSSSINVRTDLSILLDDDSRPFKIVGVSSDITSIKSSQKELERLSLIASKTSNAVVILDTNGDVEWINSGFTMMTGYRTDEVKASPFRKYLYQEKSKFSDPNYLSKQFTNNYSINEELRLKTKLKKELWVHLNISPILDYELNPVNYIFIISDITKQRMVEEELRQTEKMAALGKLSAGLAHELNNPAAATLAATEQLQHIFNDLQEITYDLAKKSEDNKLWDLLPEWLASLLQKNNDESNLSALEMCDLEETLTSWFAEKGIDQGWMMASVFIQNGIKAEDLEKIASQCPPHIISSVLLLLSKSIEVSRITEMVKKSVQSISSLVSVVKSYSYMDQAAVQYVDIHDGIEDTLKILGHKIGPEVRISKQFQKDLPKIKVLGSELNQVWTNLLENAIDAVGDKGNIEIRTSSSENRLKIEIEDSGVGIPTNIRDRIFDPFFTTKVVGDGTGLGLDVVRRIIVNRLGGKIDFISNPGKTIFNVLLPLHDQI